MPGEVLLELVGDTGEERVAGVGRDPVGDGAGVVALVLHPDPDQGVAHRDEGEGAHGGVVQDAVASAGDHGGLPGQAAVPLVESVLESVVESVVESAVESVVRSVLGRRFTAWFPVAHRCCTA